MVRGGLEMVISTTMLAGTMYYASTSKLVEEEPLEDRMHSLEERLNQRAHETNNVVKCRIETHDSVICLIFSQDDHTLRGKKHFKLEKVGAEIGAEKIFVLATEE